MTFSATEKLKALAIVAAFETGSAFGKFSTVAVLNDGAGISYGFCQFTHRSGALAVVLERYRALDGQLGVAVIADRMDLVQQQTAQAIIQLSADIPFRKALRAAGITDEMKQAQTQVALERFLHPALLECERMGFSSPLTLAVIHDSIVHGSWEKIRDRVEQKTEREWIKDYVQARDKWLASIPRLATTRYRTRFFLNQIRSGNWEMDLPVRANGVSITAGVVDSFAKYAGGVSPVRKQDSAIGPSLTNDPPNPTKNSSASSDVPPTEAQSSNTQAETRAVASVPIGNNTNCLDALENKVNAAAATYDQVERIATTAVTRNDAAKSLWTTVIGSVTQTFWALFGLVADVPREVWLVVALIAAALMLLYLYRQIALGKIREETSLKGTNNIA